jgi:hypothetical protein
MAGLLPSARGPDREVRVEKPGLPSAGLLFWCSGGLHRPFTHLRSNWRSKEGTAMMRFLTYLGLLSATMRSLAILWAFAQDPRDDLAAFA